MGNEASSILEHYDEKSGELLKSIKTLGDKKLSEINKEGNTALMVVCKKQINPIAITLLKRIDECNLSQLNKEGDTALTIACENNMDNIALKILDRATKCNLGHVNNKNQTALTIACKNNMQQVALKILDNIELCNLNYASKYNFTALMYACDKCAHTVIIKMFQYPEKCNLYHKDNIKRSALTMICGKNETRNTGIELIKIINKIELSSTDYNNNTPLMLTCGSSYTKNTSMAVEILKYVDYCALDNVNKEGDTALSLVCKHKLEVIAKEMLKHLDKCNLSHNKDIVLSWARINNMQFVTDAIKNKMNDAVDKKPIDNNLILERISKKTCIFCSDDTADHILYSKCSHTFASCNTCTPKILNKVCMVCRSTDNEVKKIYLCA